MSVRRLLSTLCICLAFAVTATLTFGAGRAAAYEDPVSDAWVWAPIGSADDAGLRPLLDAVEPAPAPRVDRPPADWPPELLPMSRWQVQTFLAGLDAREVRGRRDRQRARLAA